MNASASSSNDDELVALLADLTILILRYGLLVLVILGTMGNILNVIIFFQPKFRANPCTLYLRTASCFSLLLIVTIALPLMLSTYNLDYSTTIPILCKMRHFCYYCFSSLIVWMVALATFDRFLITSPLARRRQMSSFQNTYVIMIGSSVLLVLIFGDLFYCADVVTARTIATCTATSTRKCGFYNEIARLLTVLFTPGLVILFFGIGIIRHLKSINVATPTASRHGLQQHRIRRTDQELLKLLAGQIVMLMISWVPLGVQRLYALVTYDVPKSTLRDAAETLSDEITSVMARLDNALSFYVYLFVGGALFRETLRQLFRVITKRGRVTPLDGSIQVRGIRQL